jgi:hypothetical protein
MKFSSTTDTDTQQPKNDNLYSMVSNQHYRTAATSHNQQRTLTTETQLSATNYSELLTIVTDNQQQKRDYGHYKINNKQL